MNLSEYFDQEKNVEKLILLEIPLIQVEGILNLKWYKVDFYSNNYGNLYSIFSGIGLVEQDNDLDLDWASKKTWKWKGKFLKNEILNFERCFLYTLRTTMA